MPVEIRELLIKATLAVDWENKTISDSPDKPVCPALSSPEDINAYVNQYFRNQNSKTLTFDQRKLSAFIIEWQASFSSKP